MWLVQISGLERTGEGSVNLLKSYQEKNKLALHIANPFMIEGKVVSSSELRKKLAEGSVIEVTRNAIPLL